MRCNKDYWLVRPPSAASIKHFWPVGRVRSDSLHAVDLSDGLGVRLAHLDPVHVFLPPVNQAGSVDDWRVRQDESARGLAVALPLNMRR